MKKMSNKEINHEGRKFTRTIENFTCIVCGTEVKGTGYTDHCPNCLWSVHVDIYPGDRQAECGGLMEPIGAMQQRRTWRIYYRCQKCGYERFNDAVPGDNFEKIIELSTHPINFSRQKRRSK